MTEESLEQKSDETQIYEAGYHFLPTIEVPLLSEEVLKIKDLIVKNEGNIISEISPTLTNLAYPISKMTSSGKKDFEKSFFGSLKFDLDQINIDKIKKYLETDLNILRFIIVKTVKENTIYYNKKEIEVPTSSEIEIDKSIEALIETN